MIERPDPQAVKTFRERLTRHPLLAASALLGANLLVARNGALAGGRIVEVEAYAGPADPASHSGRYRRARERMAGEPGTLYMHRAYGIHTMCNVVSHALEQAGGVLIRAIEPEVGEETIVARRGIAASAVLTKGPGNVCQALDLALSDNARDALSDTEIRITPGSPPAQIIAGPRIGVTSGTSVAWRLFDRDSRMVSSHRRGELVELAELDRLIPPPGSVIE